MRTTAFAAGPFSRESNLAFVERPLAGESLSYRFERLEDDAAKDADSPRHARHVLIISDTAAEAPDLGDVRFTRQQVSANTLGQRGAVKDNGKLFTLRRSVERHRHRCGVTHQRAQPGQAVCGGRVQERLRTRHAGVPEAEAGDAAQAGDHGQTGASGVPKVEDMLTPSTDSGPGSAKPTGSGKPTGAGKPSGKPRASASAPKPEGHAASQRRDGGKVLVQMSREWLQENMLGAVGAFLERTVLASYSRHLIYAPVWLPAMAQHAASIATWNSHKEDTHRDHDVLTNPHYEEAEVKAAVNKKKASLREKHPSARTLGAET